jgi:DNA-binding CsgD family transcriptional regulator
LATHYDLMHTKARVLIRVATLERVYAHDLTYTEAKVLTLVADGHSRNEMADLLGVGLSTIKTHLLHLNSKTGSARQADLAKLARSLSVPI